MDFKKMNFLETLKTKLGNKRKPGRKVLARQKRNLANRRSISVPDLTLAPSEAFFAENVLDAGASDAIFFHSSPGVSDTDSIASGSVAEGHLCTGRSGDSVLEPALRVPADHAAAALNRLSAPVEMLSLYNKAVDDITSNSENTRDLTQEPLYAQVTRKAMANAPTFTFDPATATSHVHSSSQVLSPRPALVERESLSGEDTPVNTGVLSGTLASALVRAQSLGEQRNPYTEKRDVLSERGTPPAIKKITFANRRRLKLDMLFPPESADCTSLDSACGTPSEEGVNMSWTDSEEHDREQSSPLVTREFFMEEALEEETRPEEEMAEVSSETFDLFDENAQDTSENSQATTGGADVQVAAPFQRYLLNIVLKWGKNLVIRDKRSGTSDPYVKFKLEGKQFYKSKVIYKSLNPRWNESFSHPLRCQDHVVDVRVYDKNRTADDFMGSSTIPLKDLELYKTYEMELHLDDPKSKEDDMGIIVVDVCLMYRDATVKRSPRWPAKKKKQNQPAQRSAETQRNQTNNQMWSGVLSITLIEGQDLPQNGHGDVYVRFRLGEQKYKSKNFCIQANPQWREQFDFNQFEDNQEPLQVEVYSKRGRKGEESWGMFEIDLARLPLNERQLYTHVLDPGKGRLVFLVTLTSCWGVSISDTETALLEKPEERDSIEEKFSLRNSHKCVGEVGFLQVKVIKANDLPTTDLNGKSNPFCVIEVGNGKLQSHTVYKTVNPDWNKAFTFPIKDINDVVELTVLDENGDKSPNFLGKVAIPLLTVHSGQELTLFLKKENLESTSKGTITVVLDVIYNKVRAGVRTFQPKEEKFIEENLKFSKKVLAQNIYRVRKISTAVLYTLQYIKSCFQWESTQRSLLAFLIFLVTVWHWELFMLPLFLLLLIGWNYIQLTVGRATSNQDLVNISMGDDEEEDEKEGGKKGLMDKIHMVQEIVLAVQNILEEIGNIGERVKNIFNWSVPFLSVLACLVLFVSTAVLYFIPLRYIVLIWGVNKFTKKLRNPYTVDNNEILDFLKRVPSDVQKVQYSVVRAPTSQSQARKKR